MTLGSRGRGGFSGAGTFLRPRPGKEHERKTGNQHRGQACVGDMFLPAQQRQGEEVVGQEKQQERQAAKTIQQKARFRLRNRAR